MADELRDKRIAFLVANEGVEERELTEPLAAVRSAGARAEVLAPKRGEVQCFSHLHSHSARSWWPPPRRPRARRQCRRGAARRRSRSA